MHVSQGHTSSRFRRKPETEVHELLEILDTTFSMYY